MRRRGATGHTAGLILAATAAVLWGEGGIAAQELFQGHGIDGVAFGLASAAAFSYYMLASARMVRVIGSGATTAWGLSLASVPTLVWAPPWRVHPVGDAVSVTALTGIVVVVSTALAFSLAAVLLRTAADRPAAEVRRGC